MTWWRKALLGTASLSVLVPILAMVMARHNRDHPSRSMSEDVRDYKLGEFCRGFYLYGNLAIWGAFYFSTKRPRAAAGTPSPGGHE
jgi:hypothetical protein